MLKAIQKIEPPPFEQIAGCLLQTHPQWHEWAFLESDGVVYFSGRTQEESLIPYAPFSATTQLIQGMYDQFPKTARKHLRSRIYSNLPFSSLSSAMIRLAAKRSSVLQSQSFSSKNIFPPTPFRFFEIQYIPPSLPSVPPSSPLTLQDAVQQAKNNAQKARSLATPESNPRDRFVGAVLLSHLGQVLEHSWSEPGTQPTWHAELRLLQSWGVKNPGQPLPSGSVLISTLQPCKMCAAMILHCLKTPSDLKIYYGERDLGPLAQRTGIESISELWREQEIS